MEKVIDFNNACHLKDVTPDYSEIEDNYLFCHIRPGAKSFSGLIGSEPMKISGTLLMLVREGSRTTVEVNLEKYVLCPGSLLMVFPGNVIRTIGRIPTNLDVYALYYDTKFSRSVNINLASVAIPSTVGRLRTVMALTDEEKELLGDYFMLLHRATREDSHPQIKKSIATSLTAAIFYQMVQFYHKRLPEALAEGGDKKSGCRRNDYVREFVRLVYLHYMRERSVSFYADKLFISPKYLSLLVKEVTGRSAAQLIDEFVVMEAKNLLRFSGKNIQQVAYSLNFPTQSSFGKYFKHLTGMSPSAYQKG